LFNGAPPGSTDAPKTVLLGAEWGTWIDGGHMDIWKVDTFVLSGAN
jgi:hypothetical protein